MSGHLESSLRWLFLLSACVLVASVFAAGVAWACAPPDTGIPAGSAPTLAVSPTSGVGGSTTTVTARSFAPRPVEIRWDAIAGPLLATGNGPDFSTSVTIPSSQAGGHHLMAFTRTGGTPDPAATVGFQVNPSPVQPDPQLAPSSGLQAPASLLSPTPDSFGPAIAADALTRGNGTRTVTQKGQVFLFCGRFTEVVTGVCGADSTGPLSQVRTSRRSSPARSVLRLGAKRFHAAAGRPVLLKFVLSKANMKMLRAAKKVRMRGSIEARDASGNVTRASFAVTLRAPKVPAH